MRKYRIRIPYISHADPNHITYRNFDSEWIPACELYPSNILQRIIIYFPSSKFPPRTSCSLEMAQNQWVNFHTGISLHLHNYSIAKQYARLTHPYKTQEYINDISKKVFVFYCLGGIGFPLYPGIFSTVHTMILQRIKIIMGEAGFEPGTSAPKAWCASNEPPHLQNANCWCCFSFVIKNRQHRKTSFNNNLTS